MIKKHNGFNQKPHPYQIISYIYFSTLIGSYFLLLMPLSLDLSKLVGGIFEAILSLVVLISGYLVTAIDPSDPIMKKTKQAELTNTPCDIPVQELYCPADKSYVLTGSKHCKRCNRCTEEFDHHCKWVNNDVGKANYKHFFVLISSVTVFLIVYLACGISLTVDYAKDTYLIENNIYIYSNNPQQILAVMIVLWILMVISAVFLLMAGNLVLLHIYLISKGMTTYQYIIAGDARRAKSQEERAKNGPDYSKRTCLDFILCLKKRKKVVAGTFTLNGDTQKSVNKELNNHSETQTRKMSDFLKKDEAKAELDNTQNEDNICAALPASPRNHTSVSPGLIKEVNVVKKEKIFTFEKGNFDASNRALISKTDAQIEVLKTNQTNRDREEGTSPGRKDQESVHKVQTTKIRESTEREHEILEINPHQEKIKADIPLYPAQMRSASAAIEKKNLPAIRSSNHTLFAEEGRSVSQRGFQLPRLTDMNKGEQSLRDKRKYEIPNSSIDNQGL